MASIYLSSTPEITVNVLFFGAIAEIVGERQTEVKLWAGSTVGDLHAGLLSSFPALEGRHLKCAVDQQYCSWMHVLAQGEEVALFTAVSGG